MDAAYMPNPPPKRKSPPYHAAQLPPGLEMRGIDGEEWVVVQHAKTRRWAPVKKSAGGGGGKRKKSGGKRKSGGAKRKSGGAKRKSGGAKRNTLEAAKITKAMPDRKAPMYHASKLPVGTKMARGGVEWVVRKTTKSGRWVKVPKAAAPRKATKTARTTRHRNKPPRTLATAVKAGTKRVGDDGKTYRAVKWGATQRWHKM